MKKVCYARKTNECWPKHTQSIYPLTDTVTVVPGAVAVTVSVTVTVLSPPAAAVAVADGVRLMMVMRGPPRARVVGDDNGAESASADDDDGACAVAVDVEVRVMVDLRTEGGEGAWGARELAAGLGAASAVELIAGAGAASGANDGLGTVVMDGRPCGEEDERGRGRAELLETGEGLGVLVGGRRVMVVVEAAGVSLDGLLAGGWGLGLKEGGVLLAGSSGDTAGEEVPIGVVTVVKVEGLAAVDRWVVVSMIVGSALEVG
jgi:hypothetical protein